LESAQRPSQEEASRGERQPKPRPRRARPCACYRGRGLNPLGLIHAIASLPPTVLYLVILIWLILESAGAPIPNEAILLFSGYLIAIGKLLILPAWAAAALGSLGGATIAWAIAKRWGPAGVDRVGRFILLDRERLAAAHSWFARWGAYTIFLARLTPVVRTVISYPAGLAAMSYRPFAIATAVGAGIWCLFVLIVGDLAGAHWSDLFERIHAPALVIGIAIIVALIAYAVFEHVLRRRLATG
jgi:membrane protein DedA with SNARE-associated domain